MAKLFEKDLSLNTIESVGSVAVMIDDSDSEKMYRVERISLESAGALISELKAKRPTKADDSEE